jgi:hypothetical protein
VKIRYEDENIWLTQKMMATLSDVSVAAVNRHLKKIFDDGEMEPGATIKKSMQGENFCTTQRIIKLIVKIKSSYIIFLCFKFDNGAESGNGSRGVCGRR